MRERLVWAADWVCPGMTRIIADISVSLDGFVTGPDPSPDNGLGTGGEALHTWAFSDDPDDRRVLREATATSGAVVLGRHLFDVSTGRKAGTTRPATAPARSASPSCWAPGHQCHRRSAAHAGAAERDLDIDRDAPDLRRLPVIR